MAEMGVSLLQWILDNKQWLFSGIGVVIVVWIGRYLLRRFGAKQSSASLPKAAPSPPAALPDPTSITPQRIREAIAASPLLLQPDVMRQYVGIRVSWEGRLLHVKRTGRDSVDITLIQQRMDHAIAFHVAPSKYPGLGLLKEGATIKVQGVIESVDYMLIELRDAEIEFNP